MMIGSEQLQQFWTFLRETFADHHGLLLVIGPLLTTAVFYWVICRLYVFINVTNMPQRFVKYKIQQLENNPLDVNVLKKAMSGASRNQLRVGLPGLIIVAYIRLWYGVDMGPHIPACYNIPFVPSAEFHDYHHLKFNVNYGKYEFLDWLHGTDAAFCRSDRHPRHGWLKSAVTPPHIHD